MINYHLVNCTEQILFHLLNLLELLFLQGRMSLDRNITNRFTIFKFTDSNFHIRLFEIDVQMNQNYFVD